MVFPDFRYHIKCCRLDAINLSLCKLIASIMGEIGVYVSYCLFGIYYLFLHNKKDSLILSFVCVCVCVCQNN